MAKPHKVEEPAGTYAPPATKAVQGNARSQPTPATDPIRSVDEATFRKAADKVFKTHHELFRKLAQ